MERQVFLMSLIKEGATEGLSQFIKATKVNLQLNTHFNEQNAFLYRETETNYNREY
jgi:hypothetical protein